MNTLSSCSSVTSLNLSGKPHLPFFLFFSSCLLSIHHSSFFSLELDNSLSFDNLRGILSSLSVNAGIIKEINLSSMNSTPARTTKIVKKDHRKREEKTKRLTIHIYIENRIDHYGAKKIAKFAIANRSSLQKIILNGMSPPLNLSPLIYSPLTPSHPSSNPLSPPPPTSLY